MHWMVFQSEFAQLTDPEHGCCTDWANKVQAPAVRHGPGARHVGINDVRKTMLYLAQRLTTDHGNEKRSSVVCFAHTFICIEVFNNGDSVALNAPRLRKCSVILACSHVASREVNKAVKRTLLHAVQVGKNTFF